MAEKRWLAGESTPCILLVVHVLIFTLQNDHILFWGAFLCEAGLALAHKLGNLKRWTLRADRAHDKSKTCAAFGIRGVFPTNDGWCCMVCMLC